MDRRKDAADQAGDDTAKDQAGDDAAKDQATQAPAAAPPANDDYMAELEKLSKLKDEGILSDAEFEAKKKQVLGI